MDLESNEEDIQASGLITCKVGVKFLPALLRVFLDIEGDKKVEHRLRAAARLTKHHVLKVPTGRSTSVDVHSIQSILYSY